MGTVIMEHTQVIEVTEIEIALLDLRYSNTRIHNPRMISSLADSIEHSGQINPVITLKQDDSVLVLLDGYMRIAALKRCGHDTALAHQWHCNEEEALRMMLVKNQERRWQPLEQACLIRELQDRHNLPLGKIASMLGRDKSWVSRRMSLVSALSEEILKLVMSGHISTWAATRVLVPLARANAEHAGTVAKHLIEESMSTRDLVIFFEHYQKSNRDKREKMVKHPTLFIKALNCTDEENQANSLKEGPEGRWIKDLKVSAQIIRRLIKQVPAVMYPGQSRLDRRTLITVFEDANQLMFSLGKEIRRFESEDNRRDKTSRSRNASKGDQDPKNQSDPQNFKKQCAQDYSKASNGHCSNTMSP